MGENMSGSGRNCRCSSAAVTVTAHLGNDTKIITDLPEDVLYLIFSYLDVQALFNLCRVCRIFNHLVSEDFVWSPFVKSLIIIKDKNKRSHPINLKERYRLAKNWINVRYKEAALLRHRTRLLPWLQYSDLRLWVSVRNIIRCYEVQRNGYLQEKPSCCLKGLRDDVSRFVCKNDLTISGCRDGSVRGWENTTGHVLFHYSGVHASETQCVDCVDDLLISGSRDGTVKILSMKRGNEYDRVRKSFSLGERVWSIAVSPDKSSFVTGTAGCLDQPPLSVWDLDSGQMICPLGTEYRHGAGVLDIKFESPNCMLTCGYDTYLRLWDLRTQTCVAQWEEQFDSAVYCLDTDNNYTMVTGTARHGMTRLWDKRKTEHIQLYYTGQRSSPVYSLAFDARRMFVALDLSVNIIDFGNPR